MGVMVDERMIMRNDFDLLCLATSGYVTAGKSRVVSDYQNSEGTYQSDLQSRHDEKIYMENCIL